MIGGYMDAFGDKHRYWGSIKPVDEVDGIDMSGKNIKSVEGQSYQELATFLRKMGFEKEKLAMRVDRVGNRPCWWVKLTICMLSSCVFPSFLMLSFFMLDFLRRVRSDAPIESFDDPAGAMDWEMDL